MLLAPALGAALLWGCSTLAPTDARLCSAAQRLSAAVALTATAIAADERGDLAQAQGLAGQAWSLADQAHGFLQLVPADAGPRAQLLEVVAQTTLAANSLLPAYANSHGMGPDQLDAGKRALDKARADLPAMCFDIPNDVETPGPS